MAKKSSASPRADLPAALSRVASAASEATASEPTASEAVVSKAISDVVAEAAAGTSSKASGKAAKASAKLARQAAKADAAAPAVAGVQVGVRDLPPNPPTAPSKQLHVFPNPSPARDYVIQFQIPEFTCHCPLTGQPDFAHFTIDMICDALCIELKSLKMYMWSYRDEGSFHEKVTNTILDDLVAAAKPRFVRITAKWYVRGGIYTNLVVEHRQPGWVPAPRVDLPLSASPGTATGLS